MTVLTFRSRGRHWTGVPALELISRATMYDTVTAPVCGTCGSVNLNPHVDNSFGPFFICEDCMTQLDADGSRL